MMTLIEDVGFWFGSRKQRDLFRDRLLWVFLVIAALTLITNCTLNGG